MGGRVAGKVAVITGAGQGQGAATAKLLAAEGAKVVVADWNDEGAERTTAALKSSGAECLKVVEDVATPEGAQRMVDAAMTEYGRIDILHNQIFGMETGRLEDITIEGWNETFRLTVVGTFLGSKFVLPIMREQGGGVIINTGSVAGLRGDPMMAPYAAAKAAVISLTKTAATEYGPHGVRVNCICPGAVLSESFLQLFGEEPWPSPTWLTSATPAPPLDDSQIHSLRQAFADCTPIGRCTEPSEIATIVLFLASDDASTINGAVIRADGGLNYTGQPSPYLLR